MVNITGSKLGADWNIAISHVRKTHFGDVTHITSDFTYYLQLSLSIDIEVCLHVLYQGLIQGWRL
jgi:hypothetical protein